MLAAVKKAGVIHMICHNYRRAPAVMLARQLIDEGKLGRLYHYRGTYLQDWVADPSVPLVLAPAQGGGRVRRARRHRQPLARPRRASWSARSREVTGALETFVKERPLPDNPKKKGKVTVDDASASVVRFANGALGTIEASRFATGRKNYNRFEINGSKGSVVFNLERMNELEVYLTGDDPARAGVPQRHGHRRQQPSVLLALVARRAHHRLRAHVHPHRVRPARGHRDRTRCRRRTSKMACGTRRCSTRWKRRR